MQTADKFTIVKNRFNDVIITAQQNIDELTGYLQTLINNGECLILRLNSKLPQLLYDFQFITYYQGLYIYANTEALNACPQIVDNKLYGSILATFIRINEDLFFVLVKDRTKQYLTNPGGSRNLNETNDQCACRELYEETGIVCDIESITYTGYQKS